ncbi:MAG: diguanylate cyclase [Thermodesulfobacteriota bacterium]
MKLIFKNLNILRSTLNAISTTSDIRQMIESAGTNLPALFNFSSFGVFWKTGLLLHLYQEETCPSAFTQSVVGNMIKVFSIFAEEPIDIKRINLQVEKRKLKPPQATDPHPDSKSHLTLPLAAEGEILGCISLDSNQPNAFDTQDLQFFSVIGYQMAATLRHFQKLSSMKDMAIYDPLTNLHNRRHFEERLGAETQKSFLSSVPLSLIMVDIDYFKKVNDTFGHDAGDKVLWKVASLLKGSVRKDDTVARFGGEEFVLILPGAKLEVTAIIAERIRKLVETTLFDIGQRQINVTISIGISNLPAHRAKSKEELIKMADQALYQAKRGGRNRVCIFAGYSNE